MAVKARWKNSEFALPLCGPMPFHPVARTALDFDPACLCVNRSETGCGSASCPNCTVGYIAPCVEVDFGSGATSVPGEGGSCELIAGKFLLKCQFSSSNCVWFYDNFPSPYTGIFGSECETLIPWPDLFARMIPNGTGGRKWRVGAGSNTAFVNQVVTWEYDLGASSFPHICNQDQTFTLTKVLDPCDGPWRCCCIYPTTITLRPVLTCG